jgi:beta-galactosidase
MLCAIGGVFLAAIPAMASDAAPRITVNLDPDWAFHKGTLSLAEATSEESSKGNWQTISLPHTWNNLDGEDGGNNYFKGDGWYRRMLTVTQEMAGKSLILRFDGVNRNASVYINGKEIGSHVGGNAAFVFDVTNAVHPGNNFLAVRANNTNEDNASPPIRADFTFFGGIYRSAELLAVNPVHISLSDYGSPGVYITTPEITDEKASVHVRTLVKNDRAASANGLVLVQILDDKGTQVSEGSGAWKLDAGKDGEVQVSTTIVRPHRWNGRIDPYLYTVRVSIVSPMPNGPANVVDSITQPLGVRTFSVDREKGFILNGKPYDLHGVDRHQDRQDKGWAISNDDHLEDMSLIKEMGCTAIRLAHYQHAEFFYQLCDREGMVVWAEIPVVDVLSGNPAFTENARQQYIELIRQNFNHPSICFWSAGNEVDPPEPGRGRGRRGNRAGSRPATATGPAAPDVFPWFREMAKLGRLEDPSRLTTSAWRERFFPPGDVTDVFGLNEYLGWYTGGAPNSNTFGSGWEGLENYIERHSQNGVKGQWAATEYGAGSSIYFHSEKPVRMDHTEEYQALLHENTWRVFKQHPEIWGKFVWNMFDFAVDSRAEGDHAGRNDKGLVTYDRKTRKDAFYFYKAVWSSEPFAWIASKRFDTRGIERIPVKVYSNAPRVMLTVNGTTLGEKQNYNGTFLWEGVTLKEGANEVHAVAIYADGKTQADSTTFTYRPGAPTEVYVAQDDRMREALKKGSPRAERPANTQPATGPATQAE